MKPALYIVQRTGPRVRLDRLDQDTEEDTEEDDIGELEPDVKCPFLNLNDETLALLEKSVACCQSHHSLTRRLFAQSILL